MIKISKRNVRHPLHNHLKNDKKNFQLSTAKQYLRSGQKEDKPTISQVNSHAFYEKIQHQQWLQQQHKTLHGTKNTLTYRFSQFDIDTDRKYETLNQDSSPPKHTDIQIINEKLHKRYSSPFTQRNKPQKKWIQTIIRRKNNGSQGQIIKGLGKAKHDKVLQKAKMAIDESLSLNIIKKHEKQQVQFVPLGSIKTIESKPKKKKVLWIDKSKIPMKMQRKKTTGGHHHYRSNLQIRTQPGDFNQVGELSLQSNSQNNLVLFQKIFRKASNIERNSKKIAPWEVQSFV